MVNIEYTTIEEAKALRRSKKKSPIVEEYESLLLNLPEGQAGMLDAKKEKEKPLTMRNRLIRVGKSLSVADLQVKRTGDIVSFWRE